MSDSPIESKIEPTHPSRLEKKKNMFTAWGVVNLRKFGEEMRRWIEGVAGQAR